MRAREQKKTQPRMRKEREKEREKERDTMLGNDCPKKASEGGKDLP